MSQIEPKENLQVFAADETPPPETKPLRMQAQVGSHEPETQIDAP